MYSEYYGFREPPFQMTPDARLFFDSTIHRRAFAHLMFGLSQREGFIVVTGEVGAGKTTLVERLCSEIRSQNFVIARIVTTVLSGDDLLRLIADAFGAPSEGNKASIIRGITQALQTDPDRRHLLIVDEAQGLSESALEELRMLSNITLGERALLQTVLLGQPQLKRLLARPSLDQLRQRVLASFHLEALSPDETNAYILHRMRAVGWVDNPRWQDAALRLVHRHSGGIPRRINRLCARVLLTGALDQATEITAQMVDSVAIELEEDLGSIAEAAQPEPVPSLPWPSPGSVAVLSPTQSDSLLRLTERVDELYRRSERHDAIMTRISSLFGTVPEKLT